MKSNRSGILDWSDQGRIPHERLRAALELADVLPGAADWRRFLDRLLLWLGVVMLAAAATFFFAFNWNEMGKLANEQKGTKRVRDELFLNTKSVL